MAASLAPGVDLSQIPAGTPPAGITPNLLHPSPSLRPTVIGVTVTMMVIGVALAITSTLHRLRSMIASDYLLLAAVVVTIAYSVVEMSNSNIAIHQWDASVAKLADPRIAKLDFASDELTCFSIFLAKCAILTLYLKIFKINFKFRLAVYVGYLLDFIAYFPQVIAAPILCAARVGEPWGLSVGQRCKRDSGVGIYRSVAGTLLDIYLFMLPIPLVASLAISKRKKLGIMAIFGTAFLGIVASICSLAYVIIDYKTSDQLWSAAVIQLCNIIETWVAIIVASVPGFASAFKRGLIETGLLQSWTISLRSLLTRTRGSNESRGGRSGTSAAGWSGGLPRHTGEDSHTHLHDVNIELDTRTGQPNFSKSNVNRIGRTVDLEQYEERRTTS